MILERIQFYLRLVFFGIILFFFDFGITEEAMAEERVGPDAAANLSLEIWTWIFYLIFFFVDLC